MITTTQGGRPAFGPNNLLVKNGRVRFLPNHCSACGSVGTSPSRRIASNHKRESCTTSEPAGFDADSSGGGTTESYHSGPHANALRLRNYKVRIRPSCSYLEIVLDLFGSSIL